ncbi:hypothetical protein ACJ8PO_23685, partial [Serratia sp. CY66160]|uniref:hypothetical protein n=1 Tax=Serratia sp. CY66160 TaxID=3383658 RepID=UPI003FA0A47E
PKPGVASSSLSAPAILRTLCESKGFFFAYHFSSLPLWNRALLTLYADVCPILVASCSSELYPAGLLILISFCIIFSQKAMSAFWCDRQA